MYPIYIMIIENDDDRNLAERLYIEYKEKMYNIAYKRLSNVSDAEDAVSEAFEKIIKHISHFHNRSCNETEGLVVLIVRNTCIDKLRRTKKIKFIPVDEEINIESDDSKVSDISEIVINEIMFESVLKEVNCLNEEYKIVVMLKTQDFSNKEIAGILGISEENVRVRYHRAILKVKKALIRKGRINNYE